MKDLLKEIKIVLLRIALPPINNSRLELSNVLILVPHPDDEIMGMGGILLNLVKQGSRINLVYLTDGEGSGVWYDKELIKQKRIKFSEESCCRLGIKPEFVTRLHLPDSAIPQPNEPGFNETVGKIAGLIDIIKPHALFSTHSLDYWPFDHVATAHIAKEAVTMSDTKPELWYYWVWAWYNIRPWQIFGRKSKNIQKVDIREHIKLKMELTDIYLRSLTPDGKPWSGILPKPLLKAFAYPFEIVEKII